MLKTATAIGLVAALHGAQAAPEGCVPVDGDYEFSFPSDFYVHPQQNYEWTWIFGTVTASQPVERGFGVMLGISRIAADCASLSDGLFTTGISISDNLGDAFYYEMAYDTGGSVDQGEDHVAGKKFSYSGQGDTFQIESLMNGLGFNLTLTDEKGVAFMGHNGFDVNDDYEPITAHIDQTALTTTGTVTLPTGEEFEIDGGLIYMQHEWGVSSSSSSSSPGQEPEEQEGLGAEDSGRYDWMTAQLDNGVAIVAIDRAPDNVYNDTSPYSYVNVANMPGATEALWLHNSEWTMTRDDPWTSPHVYSDERTTGDTWFRNHTLSIPSLGCEIQWHTFIADNEVHDPLRNRTVIEGASAISGVWLGEPVEGTGWTGLNHELLG